MKRKIYLALIFLVILIGISAVSASENVTGDIINSDASADIVSNDNEEFDLKTGNSEILNYENNTLSSTDTRSFAELNDAINSDKSKREITLNDNYKYNGESEFKEGIVIDRNLVIYGNGITIDGSNVARIFKITSGTTTFYNINFINGNSQDCRENHNGGAILGKGIAINCNFTDNKAIRGGAISGGLAINCNFKNNIAPLGGGAAYNCNALNCIFTDNIAENESVGGSGGAMLYGSAENCTFIANKAPYGGGAIYKCNAENCNFIGNQAKVYGGAMYESNATNCNFIGNQAKVYGGAMYEGNATNCNFTNNIIAGTGNYIPGVYENGTMKFNNTFAYDSEGYEGGAIHNGTAKGCKFIGNQANYGGAISNTYAENCVFTDNKANYGGAMSEETAKNCIFTNNRANNEGGAMYGGSAKNCTFALNFADTNYDVNQTDCDAYCKFISNLISVSNFTSVPGSGEKLLFNLSYENHVFDGINTTILIIELNRTYYANSGEGWVVDLPMGTYTATLNVEHANVKEAVATLNILNPSKIIANKTITTYNHDDYLLFELLDGDDNTPIDNSELSVKLNGETTIYTTVNGQIQIPTMGLSANNYAIEITFKGNGVYGKSIIQTTITVLKDASKITANNVTTTYNTTKNLLINLMDNSGKPINGATVTVNLNGAKNYTTDNKGQITIPIGTTTPNTYTATITFPGNENYTGSKTTSRITIQKGSSKITANNVTTTYNTAKDLLINLTDSNDKPIVGATVTVNLNGAKNYTTDNKGQITIPIGTTTPNTYTATITFAGNEYYIGTNTLSAIVINKASPKIIAKAKTFKIQDKNKKYAITLKNNERELMRNAKVSLKVNGKTYTAKTSTKGVATFKLTKLTKKGKFTAVITYPEDVNYKKAATKVKITVKDSPKIIAKAKTTIKNKRFTATLKTYKGSAMKKTLLTLKVKGQTYKALTNKKGVATFKLTKLTKKGKYSATISYKGNAYNNKASKRVVLIL